jgi:mono/diheme cytochrome c family protein
MSIVWRATALVAACAAGATISFGAVQPLARASGAADIPRAPERLSETGLYRDGRIGTVDPINRSFAPQYALWSDGAVKTRWVYLPPGAAIDATDEHAWTLPDGTRFWKEFRFDGRPVETRMIWKAAGNAWVFASYAWNADGTDAMLAPSDGLMTEVDVAPGRRHAIPSVSDCQACHGTDRPRALGFNALQLSDDIDQGAIHLERTDPSGVTLGALLRDGRLTPAPSWNAANMPRIRTADADTRAVLGYLFANCGSCHDGSGDIAAVSPVLRPRDLVTNGDEVARSLVDRPTLWQAPGSADGTTVALSSRAPHDSAILLRMTSRRPSSQMPPLGTVVRDERAIRAIDQWTRRFAAGH